MKNITKTVKNIIGTKGTWFLTLIVFVCNYKTINALVTSMKIINNNGN